MNDLVGIPYKIGGKDKSGADCIGVAAMWLRSQGIDVQYEDGLGKVTEDWFVRRPRRFIDALTQMGDIIRFVDLKKFDCLLLYGSEMAAFPSCLAVMIDDRHALSATPERGSFVDILDIKIRERFWGAIRLHAARGKI